MNSRIPSIRLKRKMNYIDPHIHIASRTTDELAQMAATGCRMVGEPAFWMGFDRSGLSSFVDYFRQLTEWEPRRCANYGIQHFCWMGINAKEAEDVQFSTEVIAELPRFLDRPTVLGIGEVGLHKCTKNEIITLEKLIDLALDRDELILFHTPHLEDKFKGTQIILDLLKNDPRTNPDRILVDHLEEHTIRPVRDAGFWGGVTLYPTTKCTPERMVDLIEIYGTDRLTVNSSADWGPSDPLAVSKFIAAAKRRGHDEEAIGQLVYQNPIEFWNQSHNVQVAP
jgi:uncharacterized protein